MKHKKMAKMTAKTEYYEIRLQGQLEARWVNRFDGMTITLDDNGDTLLSGQVVDQAALHGLLKKVRDLGMPLLSVHHGKPDRKEALEG